MIPTNSKTKTINARRGALRRYKVASPRRTSMTPTATAARMDAEAQINYLEICRSAPPSVTRVAWTPPQHSRTVPVHAGIAKPFHHDDALAKPPRLLEALFRIEIFGAHPEHRHGILLASQIQGIRLDCPRAVPFHHPQGSSQRLGCNAHSSMILVDEEASDSPETILSRGSVSPLPVYAGQLNSRTELAPADWLSCLIDQDTVRPALVDEVFLLDLVLFRGPA